MAADTKATSERAGRLREQIAQLKSNSSPTSSGVEHDNDSDSATATSKPAMSPREFIHKRMRELDRKA